MHVNKLDFIALQKYLYDEVEIFKAGPKPFSYDDQFSLRKCIRRFCEAHGLECTQKESNQIRDMLFDLKIVKNSEPIDSINDLGVGYVVKKPD